eukprot:NODE_221_length_12388_cov_2.350883.p7 type:complete len:249 gc:universal NODE_221_length_12388_cov_2.350883:5585-4839(-)
MLKRVATIFEQIAPKTLEAPWDNTGILVEPFELRTSNKILLTIDLTKEVLNEAIANEVSVIVAYHPIIFKGIKRIVHTDPKQFILSSLLYHGIGVYCPHTRLDSMEGGINDWLLSPFDGDLNVPQDKSGRSKSLSTSIEGDELIKIMKNHLSIPYIQVANSRKNVSSIAVCAGSGGSVLPNFDAHCYITGELGHHEILNLAQNDKMVIVTNHTNTERGYLKVLQRILLKEGLEHVQISMKDRDPLSTQ